MTRGPALGLYRPGSSPLHRLPAGPKLAVMVAAGIGSVFLDHAWQVALALAVVAAGYASARLPWRTALAQVRPLLWVAGAAAAFHVVVSGWERAFVVVGVLLALVLLAGAGHAHHPDHRPGRRGGAASAGRCGGWASTPTGWDW